MHAHHASLKQPHVKTSEPPGAEHPDIFVAFAEPVSPEWLALCSSRFRSRVTRHFQLSETGFLLQQVPADQKGSEVANLEQMVDEVNTALRKSLG